MDASVSNNIIMCDFYLSNFRFNIFFIVFLHVINESSKFNLKRTSILNLFADTFKVSIFIFFPFMFEKKIPVDVRKESKYQDANWGDQGRLGILPCISGSSEVMAQKKLEHSRNDIDLRNKSTYAHFYFSPYTNVLLEEDHGDANLEEGSPRFPKTIPTLRELTL